MIPRSVMVSVFLTVLGCDRTYCGDSEFPEVQGELEASPGNLGAVEVASAVLAGDSLVVHYRVGDNSFVATWKIEPFAP